VRAKDPNCESIFSFGGHPDGIPASAGTGFHLPFAAP